MARPPYRARAPIGWAFGMATALLVGACAQILGFDRAELDVSDAPVVSPDGSDAGSDSPRDPLPEAEAGNPPRSYSARILADGPKGYWRLDDAPGVEFAHDEMDAHPAKVQGTVSFVDGGVAGGSAIFDSDGFLSLGDAFDFTGKSAYSVELWARPTLTQQFHNLAVKHLDNGGVGFALYFRHEAMDRVEFEQHWLPGGSRGGSIPFEAGAGTKLVHIVLTYDAQPFPKTGSHLYIDGNPTDDTAHDSFDGGPPDSGQQFQWGDQYVGILDELAIYDKALTSQQVMLHYQAGR